MSSQTIREFWSEPVGSLPLQQALTIGQKATVADAIKLMQDNRKGCVCVQDDAGRVVGIFTERDVMWQYVATSLPPEAPIEDVMTKDPVMVGADTPLSRAIEIFHERAFHHLPVRDGDGQLKGLLSIRVVVEFVAENLPAEVLNLPPDSSIVSREASGG